MPHSRASNERKEIELFTESQKQCLSARRKALQCLPLMPEDTSTVRTQCTTVPEFMPLVADQSPRRSIFEPTPIHVGCVVDKVELGWYVLRHLGFLLSTLCGPGSSVGIATNYGLDGPGSNAGGDEIFCPGAHPASCKMGTVSFSAVKCGRGVLLTTHPLLVPRSWKSRAVPLPTLWATPGL